MKANRGHELLVGLLFFASLTLLVVFTAVLVGVNFTGQILTVRFANVEGLERGDNARISGLQIGRVQQIALDPEGGAIVKIQLREPVTIHEEYSIQVEDSTLLGGKVVQIKRGNLSLPVIEDGKVLQGSAMPSAARSAGAILDDNRENLAASIRGIRDFMDAINQGRGTLGQLTIDPTIAESLTRLLATLESLTGAALEGKGIIGGLIQDEAAWELFRGTLANAYEISGLLKDGQGTFAQLLREAKLLDSLTETTQGIQRIVAHIESGEGNVGKLVFDDTVYTQLDDALTRFVSVAEKLDSGEGVLPLLLNDGDVATDLRDSVADLRAAIGEVQQGQGTLGLLIRNPQLYDQLTAAVASLGGAIEDARETAPLNTFATALFSVF